MDQQADSGTWDEQRLIAHGFERIHVELERYNGPRHGVADVGGVPHYFQCLGLDVLEDPIAVWPVSSEAMAIEQEAWAIYVQWLERFEAGEAEDDDHPGHGGVDARYDELNSRLAPHRQAPADARRLMADFRFDDGDERFRFNGVDQWVQWRPVE